MRIRALASLAATLAMACSLHPFNNGGGPVNLALEGDRIAVALGERGMDLVDEVTGLRVAHVDVAGESDSYDDVAIADGWVFALDADDGYLSVFDARGLVATTRDAKVEVGPYSGVAAAAGRVVVSGGTKSATVFRYDARGALTPGPSIVGHRGKPDVAVDRGGKALFFSTHFSDPVDGQEFGLSVATGAEGRFVDAVGLAGAGFTEGGGRPASWPARSVVTANHVFVAHGGGLSIVEWSSELDLTLLATLDVGMMAVDVAVEKDTAWVVGAAPPALVEVNVTDPRSPSVRKRTPLSEPASAIVVGRTAISIAHGGGSLETIAR